MQTKIKVLLIYGGKSGEHEVSLASAASVLKHLNPEKYAVKGLAIDKNGKMFLHEGETLRAYEQKLPVTDEEAESLPCLMRFGELALDCDVVFPVVHGPLYEDGALQGLLKLANTAFVGSDVLGSAVGMDKDIARRLALQCGWPSAKYHTLSSFSTLEEKEAFCASIAETLNWPFFVKPCSLGSSVGIQKVYNKSALLAAINDAACYDETVIIEEQVVGREIELAVLQKSPGERPLVSIAGEIKVKNQEGFYSYSAKYLEESQTELIVPAPMSAKLLTQLQQAASDIFLALKCKGLARVDFFVDENDQVIFNEINTLPGFTIWSMYPRLWRVSGIAYEELLDHLISEARHRQQLQQHILTSYQ